MHNDEKLWKILRLSLYGIYTRAQWKGRTEGREGRRGRKPCGRSTDDATVELDGMNEEKID